MKGQRDKHVSKFAQCVWYACSSVPLVQQHCPVFPSIEIPFPSPLRSRMRSSVFGSINGSIATFISFIVTIMSSDSGSSRASPILGCPQPQPAKKIRMLLAFSSLNIKSISSRAASVMIMFVFSLVFVLYYLCILN